MQASLLEQSQKKVSRPDGKLHASCCLLGVWRVTSEFPIMEPLRLRLPEGLFQAARSSASPWIGLTVGTTSEVRVHVNPGTLPGALERNRMGSNIKAIALGPVGNCVELLTQTVNATLHALVGITYLTSYICI